MQTLEFGFNLIQLKKLVHKIRIVQAFISSTLVISIVDVGSQHTLFMPRIGLFEMWIF